MIDKFETEAFKRKQNICACLSHWQERKSLHSKDSNSSKTSHTQCRDEETKTVNNKSIHNENAHLKIGYLQKRRCKARKTNTTNGKADLESMKSVTDSKYRASQY